MLLFGGASAWAQTLGLPDEEEQRLDAIPPGHVAQPFALPDQQGNIHRLKDYAGQYLLVTFWSIDCRHCQREMIELERAYPMLKSSNYEIIAIHAGGRSPQLHEFVKRSRLSYPMLYDVELSMGEWGIPAIPTTYIIGPDGQRLYRAIGPRQWSERSLLERLQRIAHQARGKR